MSVCSLRHRWQHKGSRHVCPCSCSEAGCCHGSASAFLPVKSDSYTPQKICEWRRWGPNEKMVVTVLRRVKMRVKWERWHYLPPSALLESLFPLWADLLIGACWWKLSLSNYCPSSACHCVLCSQHVLTLTPDTTALCRSACARHRGGRSPCSPLPGRQPSWGEARTRVRPQSEGWKECDSSRESAACSQAEMCSTMIHSIPRPWLPRERSLQKKIWGGGAGMLLVVIGGRGLALGGAMRINHFYYWTIIISSLTLQKVSKRPWCFHMHYFIWPPQHYCD